MSMLLENAPVDSYAEVPDALALDQQPTVFDRLKTVFHDAVEYVGDTLSTPARQLTAGVALAGTALATMGALAPAAQAKSARSNLIVINEGIGGVDIGQTAKQVQKEAGTPTSEASSVNWYYDNKSPFAEVSFGSNQRVDFISPNSTRDKTSKGIGEDSSEAQVQAAYPDATCGPQPGPGGTTDLNCGITKKLPGGKTVETSFTFNTADGSGGVNTVSISEF